MGRYHLSLLTLLLLACLVRAQSADPQTSEEKGTFLGVLISPVPEVLYDQVPEMPRGSGVVINHVLPESPALAAGLRRHDILLEYDGALIRDGEHFARLIRASKPDHKVKLLLLRGGRRQTVEATLTLGPLLKIAGARPADPARRDHPMSRSVKYGGPPSVSVAATPLDGGRLKVTIEYYVENTGRTRSVVCEGTLPEIETEVHKLPDRVQSLTNVALQRIRALELAPASAPRRLAPTPKPR